jgi:hypothetical protein
MTNLAQIARGSAIDSSKLHPTTLLLLAAIIEFLRAGWTDPPMRALAARIHRRVRCTQMHKKALLAGGYLTITRRRIGPKQCLTDVYEVPGFIPPPPGAKMHRDALRTNTKIKASSPPAAATNPPPEIIRVFSVKLAAAEEQWKFWKSKAMRDGNQHRQQMEFFRGYIQRGEHQANGRLWAWVKIQEQQRMRQRAFVGMYIEPTPETKVS